MNSFIQERKTSLTHRVLSGFIAFSFLLSIVLPSGVSYAQLIQPAGSGILNLPAPGAMVPLSPSFMPPILQGITVYPENPFQFDFIVSPGEEKVAGQALKEESRKLIKYFLASLTTPEDELWVNLSPHEKDRIVPEALGQTEMGRDMLAQDYLLKQLAASLIFPENELGKKFWDRVYAKTERLYGTRDIPLNTFNKVWVVPEKAVVYESGKSAFVVESHLKVMLEEDYLALKKNLDNAKYGTAQLAQKDTQVISGVTSEIVREVLIPEIEKEVNEGKTFANLRQVFNSLILAAWYKQKLQDSLLGQIYVNQNKVKGVDVEDKDVKNKIYAQYIDALKKGVFDYIKEDYDPVKKELVPRKYFSGGLVGKVSPKNITTVTDIRDLTRRQRADLPKADSQSVQVRLEKVMPGKETAALPTVTGENKRDDQGPETKSGPAVETLNAVSLFSVGIIGALEKEGQILSVHAGQVVVLSFFNTIVEFAKEHYVILIATAAVGLTYYLAKGVMQSHEGRKLALTAMAAATLIGACAVGGCEQETLSTEPVLAANRGDSAKSDIEKALNDPSEIVRLEAAQTLVNAGVKTKEVVSVAIAALEKGNTPPKDRSRETPNLLGIPGFIKMNAPTKGAELLGKIGPVEPRVTTALIKALEQNSKAEASNWESEMIRLSIVIALFNEEFASPEVAAALIKLSTDSSSSIRSRVPLALSGFGPIIPEVVPAIIKMTKDSHRFVRISAVLCLSHFAEKYPDLRGQVAPILIGLLQDSEIMVRFNVVLTIKRVLGADAKRAIPDLKAALRVDKLLVDQKEASLSEKMMLRELVAITIKEIRGDYEKAPQELTSEEMKMFWKENFDKIEKPLDSTDRQTRQEALTFLLTKVRPTLPSIYFSKMVNPKDPRSVPPAMGALGSVGAATQKAVSVLIIDLNDKDDSVRLAAVKMLEQFGLVAVDAIPALKVLSADSNQEIRRAADKAIQEISGDDSGLSLLVPERLGLAGELMPDFILPVGIIGALEREGQILSVHAGQVVVLSFFNTIVEFAKEHYVILIATAAVGLTYYLAKGVMQSHEGRKLALTAMAAATLIGACAAGGCEQEPPGNKAKQQPAAPAVLSNSTELVFAANQGDSAKVAALLKAGVNVNSLYQGASALILAAQNGHKTIVQSLLNAKASVNLRGPNGMTALSQAAFTGRTEIVDLLLSSGADVNAKWDQGSSSLLMAAQNGHIGVVQLLLQKGANPNIQDQGGATALMAAVFGGDSRIVQALLEKGANVNLQRTNGVSALLMAVADTKTPILKMLLDYGADVSVMQGLPLNLACQKGDLPTVKLLLDKKADINMLNDAGATALWSAVQYRHPDVVRELVTRGANIHKDAMGMPPLFVAIQKNELEITRILLDNGANVNSELTFSKELVIGTLQRLIASPDIQKQLSAQDYVRLKEWLGQGVNALGQMREGVAESPLAVAAALGSKEMVSLLLQRGANVNYQDADGLTPLDIAIGGGYAEIAEMLKAAGGKSRRPSSKKPDFDGLAWSALMLFPVGFVSAFQTAKQKVFSSGYLSGEMFLLGGTDARYYQMTDEQFGALSASGEAEELAPEPPGGIDFNSALFNLEIRRDTNGMPLPATQQPVFNMNIEGLVPIIINIVPVTNLPLLLGTTEPTDNDNQARRNLGGSALVDQPFDRIAALTREEDLVFSNN